MVAITIMGYYESWYNNVLYVSIRIKSTYVIMISQDIHDIIIYIKAINLNNINNCKEKNQIIS